MRHLFIIASLFTLGACMGAPASTPNTPQPSIAQEKLQATTLPETSSESEGEVQVETPVQPMLKADYTGLMGLNPRSVQAMVGEPTLVRRDENVQVMLYEIPACVLEVIFYEPDPQASFEAKRISARQRNGDDIDTAECLEAVLPDGYWLENPEGY